MVFQSISPDSLEEDVEKSRRKRTFLSDFNCCPEPFSFTAIEAHCASGFAVEAPYDYSQVGIDVVYISLSTKGLQASRYQQSSKRIKRVDNNRGRY